MTAYMIPRLSGRTKLMRDPAGIHLVFAHGWGVDESTWAPLIRSLGGSYSISNEPVPGLAVSTHGSLNTPWSIDLARVELARRVSVVSKGLVVLIGSSASGCAALAAAEAAPRRLAGTIAIGAAARFLRSNDYDMGMTNEAAEALVGAIRVDPVKLIGALGPAALWNDTNREASARVGDGILATLATCSAVDRLADRYEETLRVDIRCFLPGIKIPVLLLHGELDSLAPPSAGKYLAARIQGGRLAVMPGAGHLPHATSPDHVAAVIRTFVEQF